VTPSRKHLSAKGLLAIIHEKFSDIESPCTRLKKSSKPIALVDCLMSGLAIFSMKFPSLLQFEGHAKHNEIIKRNLRTLYQIEQVPSDTYLRERLDEINPREVRKVFKKIFASVQRGKALEEFTYLNDHYLMPMDMTGFFSSPSIHCDNCCVKQHHKPDFVFVETLPKNSSDLKSNTYILCKEGYNCWELFYINEEKELKSISIDAVPELKMILIGRDIKHIKSSHKEDIKKIISDYHNKQFEGKFFYYHNMMCAAIVHPDKKIVLPFAPEPVRKTDGLMKNDCERNSTKRLIEDIRREHPHLKLIAVQDALGANYPNLQELKFANIRFIVGVKSGDHKALFDLVNHSNCHEYQHATEDGKTHRYRFINDVPLNSNACFDVNFLEYWETDKKGNEQHFSWVTDIQITDENVYQLMRGGRANWRLENNIFNTLKNKNYHFSHNFGHGYKHLCTIFGLLMMLAFFVDQVQELSCDLFKKARNKLTSRIGLWSMMKSLFTSFLIASWEDLYNAIAHGHEAHILNPNTS
jgi:hypothetical protein